MNQEKKKLVSITLKPKTHQKLKRFAQETHTTVSAAIEDWAWNVLDKKYEEKENNGKK